MENETAPHPPAPTPPPRTASFFESIRRIGVSRTNDRWMGGVAAGLGHRFGIDPLIVRGLLVVSVLLSGVGFVLYGLAWAFLPEADDERIHVEQAIRGDFDVALIGAGAFTLVGLIRADQGWWFYAPGLAWLNGLLWIAAIALVVYLIVGATKSSRRKTAPAQSAQPTPSTQSTQPTQQMGPLTESATAAAAGTSSAQTAYGTYYYPTHDADSAAAGFRARAEDERAWAETQNERNAARSASTRAAEERTALRRAERERAQALRPRPAGPTVVGATLGLILLLGAGLLVANRIDLVDLPLIVTWVTASILLTGLTTVAVGIAGRRSGGLMGLAIVLIISLPGAVVADALRIPDDAGVERTIASGTYSFDSAAEASEGVAFGMGDMTLNLDDLDFEAGAVTIPIAFSLGTVTVLLPPGTTATADVDLTAGNVDWSSSDGRYTSQTTFNSDNITMSSTDPTSADPDADIALNITGTAGSVYIVEATS